MRRVLFFLLVLLATFLLVQAAFSLQWPITHDEAPLFYETFLMHDQGRVPYRDIFDFQMPGSFAAYSALGLLSGFSAFRIRILDLLLLSTLLTVTFFLMRRFGRPAALAAALLFGLRYLQGGPSMSLQREYILLIFIALAVWVTLFDDLIFRRRILIGLLFGLAAVIKPHAAIGLLPILLFDITEIIKRLKLTLLKAAAESILPTSAGFLIPVLIIIAWLGFAGALIPFLGIAVNYWPLYSQINGQMEITLPAQRMFFLLDQVWRLGGNGFWLIPAMIGIFLNQNRRTYLLVSLALSYAIYPALSGQFFPYHYIPFIYFIILLGSLSISKINLQSLTFKSLLIQLISFIFLCALIRPSSTFIRQLEGRSIATSTDRSAEIAQFLQKNLEKGDTVQPLDWTGGALLAMLETRAHIATPYVFDFYFYHHVSTSYIKFLRADFINDLQTSPPRFIIEVTAIDKPWISGADTSREFPELREFLNGNYSVTIQKEDYVIYKRH